MYLVCWVQILNASIQVSPAQPNPDSECSGYFVTSDLDKINGTSAHVNNVVILQGFRNTMWRGLSVDPTKWRYSAPWLVFLEGAVYKCKFDWLILKIEPTDGQLYYLYWQPLIETRISGDRDGTRYTHCNTYWDSSRIAPSCFFRLVSYQVTGLHFVYFSQFTRMHSWGGGGVGCLVWEICPRRRYSKFIFTNLALLVNTNA